MSENKSLIISDEKFIRKMEENSLNPKKNNCSSFGRKDDFLDIKIKANSVLKVMNGPELRLRKKKIL